jgi:hypothetical protein
MFDKTVSTLHHRARKHRTALFLQLKFEDERTSRKDKENIFKTSKNTILLLLIACVGLKIYSLAGK